MSEPVPGYIMFGPCWSCGRIIGFNPEKVPSIPVGEDGHPAIGGDRKPLCRDCVEAANVIRRAEGGPVWTIDDDAYEPVEGLPE